MEGFVQNDRFRVVSVFESKEVIEGCDLVTLMKKKGMLGNTNVG